MGRHRTCISTITCTDTRYDTIDHLHWKTDSLIYHINYKKTKNVLDGTKEVKKNKNQETDGYGRDKRPETEKLNRKEITITEN